MEKQDGIKVKMVAPESIPCSVVMLPAEPDKMSNALDMVVKCKKAWTPAGEDRIHVGDLSFCVNYSADVLKYYHPQHVHFCSSEKPVKGDYVIAVDCSVHRIADVVLASDIKIVASTDRALGKPPIAEDFLREYAQSQGAIVAVHLGLRTEEPSAMRVLLDGGDPTVQTPLLLGDKGCVVIDSVSYLTDGAYDQHKARLLQVRLDAMDEEEAEKYIFDTISRIDYRSNKLSLQEQTVLENKRRSLKSAVKRSVAAILDVPNNGMIFEISESELSQIKAWQEKQGTPPVSTAIGGRWVYSFNPTSVGTMISVKDLATGDEFSPEVNW